MIVNGVEIYKDVKAAGADMQTQQYEAAGKLYGTVAATILWGAQNMAVVYDQ